MKTINRIQYFLFALILLGMFASFAQNDYSYYLLIYPHLFLGISFFIEAILLYKESRLSQSTTIFSVAESFSLGLFFCGAFLTGIHLPGAGSTLSVGSLLILILYFGLGIRSLFMKDKNGRRNFILSYLALGACLAMIAYSFKSLHWKFAMPLTLISTALSIIFLLLVISNKKVQAGIEKLSFRDHLRQIKIKLVLSYVFFSFWTVYITLVSFGIAPGLYSIANPPVLEKMYQEQNPAAEIYQKNFRQFLENRKASENTQQDNLSTNK